MAPRRSGDWLIFLPESGSEFRYGDRGELEDLVGRRIARSLNFLVINKPGLGPDYFDRDMFEESFRRTRRIEDAVVTLKKLVPKNARIHLVGYSEGAYLAPQLSLLDRRVCSMCLIGGGTRGWLKEELNNASKSEKAEYEKKAREILRSPTSIRKWHGFSYATWYSYRGDQTFRALRDVRVPTLAILGARDRVIDLKTTIVDLVLVSERQQIQIHVFGNCGHYFSKHWKQVSRVLGRFLGDL
jgi:pimeloyl-ACP methyl ester carboxylesterase